MSEALPTNTADNTADAAAHRAEKADAEGRLTQLYTMSRTAGMTNQEYVAVNPMAIVAVLLGLISALAFLAPLLLLIPAVAVFFSVLAIRQINDSNQTQTGKALAWLGLLIALACGLGTAGILIADGIRSSADEKEISKTIAEVGRLLKAGDYPAAYEHFDPVFQERWKLADFTRTWEAIKAAAGGPVEKFEWNQVPPIASSAGGARLAHTKVLMKFPKGAEDRYDIALRESGSKWRVIDLPSFFFVDRRKKAGDDFNLDPTGR